MKKFVTLIGFVLLLLCAVCPAAAHSIDYLAANISPAAEFNGNSGNFRVTNPVQGGATISFTLTFQVVQQGDTTKFPRTVAFGASTEPEGATVAVSAIPSCTFVEDGTTKIISTCAVPVTITAPAASGAYTVKIAPTSGTGGKDGLSGGGGIAIAFTVANPPAANITQVPTFLAVSVGDSCLVLHAPTVALSATLTPVTPDLVGKAVTFTVDGNAAGIALVQSNGVAATTFNSSLLPVGDHTVSANFAGATVGNTEYLASAGSATLGVQYTFIGFQKPINADGSSIFNGKVVPVKIKIADYNVQPVVDATANVFFAKITNSVAGTDQEAAAIGSTSPDGGNTMRYDPLADQYIFNWDNSLLANGTYQILVGLGEGSCALPHTVTLSLGKKK